MALDMCKKIKELGYEVSLNIICTSHISIKSFMEIKEKVESQNFLDFLCLADSYGALTPDHVKTILNIFTPLTNVLIGFHAHDNMSLSMANTIVAIDSGVDMIDGTYTGMGRGGGNLPLELITLYLNVSKGYNFSLEPLFRYLDKLIMGDHSLPRVDINYITKIKEAICGILNVHPYRLKDIKEKSITEIYNKLYNLPTNDKARYPSKWLKTLK